MTSLLSYASTHASTYSSNTVIGDRRGREGQTEYTVSKVPIARGLNYGAARNRGGGGLSNKHSGMGAGERYGMSAGSVRGLGRKVKPLKLQTGATVYIDLLCSKCGYENLPTHKRLRCDTCGVPLAQLHPDDANAGKNTLKTYTGQDDFSPASSGRLERRDQHRKELEDFNVMSMSSLDNIMVNNNNHTGRTTGNRTNRTNRTNNNTRGTGTDLNTNGQLVVMAKSMSTGATIRKQGYGGLGAKRNGMGPGARHGMAVGAVRHLPASTRSIRLHDGNIITVDVLCRKCGFEQRPDWNGLRCQNCKQALDQLGSLLTNHQFRAVGWHTSYKNKQMRELKEKRMQEAARGGQNRQQTVHTQYGTNSGDQQGQIFGFSGESIRSMVQKAKSGADEAISIDGDGPVRKPKRAKPSLSNLRHETNDVIGDWACAIDSITGDDYFYNRRTKVVTWNCPRELAGLL